MDKHRIRGNFCLACGELLDLAVAAAARSVPKPGDITVCFYCGYAMAYAADMMVRELNDRELRFLLAHPELTQQVRVVRGQVRKSGKGNNRRQAQCGAFQRLGEMGSGGIESIQQHAVSPG